MSKDIKLLQRELFREGANTYAILDGASVPGLLAKLQEWEPEYVCLYRGELKPDLAEVAPYLVRLSPDADMTTWILSEGWGNHWGIFAISDVALQALRQHLRRLLTVHDERGKPLLFRFYDPRVLREYLPTCQGNELRDMFGPVVNYACEIGEGQLAAFELDNAQLTTTQSTVWRKIERTCLK